MSRTGGRICSACASNLAFLRRYQTMARTKRPPQRSKRPPLTHFLCLPLVTSVSRMQLEQSIDEFRREVTTSQEKVERAAVDAAQEGQDVTLPAVPPKAIRPVGSIHCTLGVMSLDASKLSAVAEYLQGSEVNDLLKALKGESASALEEVVAGSSSRERPITPPKSQRPSGPLVINMKGLVSMHAAQKTSILYAEPVDQTGRLYPFCLALQKLFKDKGFLVEDDRKLKLHATIVNTIYAKGRKRAPGHGGSSAGSFGNAGSAEQTVQSGQTDRSQGHGPNANAPLKINATGILEKYKDFVWAEDVVLDRVAICEMGAKQVLNDKGEEMGAEYTEVAMLSLPT